MTEKPSIPSNIYTVLTIVALIALLAGITFVVMRSQTLFGTWNPMDAKDLSSLLPTRVQSLLG